jgi:hypothetical protein
MTWKAVLAFIVLLRKQLLYSSNSTCDTSLSSQKNSFAFSLKDFKSSIAMSVEDTKKSAQLKRFLAKVKEVLGKPIHEDPNWDKGLKGEF